LLRLTADERLRLTEQVVEFTAGRGTVFAGVGSESAKQACLFAIAAQRAGCDAVMATPPVTARVSAGALFEYYRQLADCIALPIIVQDASGYVGQAIPLDVLIRLLDRYGPEKILFKPEAQPIGPKLSELRDASSRRAAIFEGSGGIALVDSFRRGIAGTMPGMDLLDGVVALWRALLAGDEARAYQLYFPICAMIALQLQAGLDGFLAIEKYLLVKRGIFRTARRREPNSWQLDVETQSEVDRLFKQLLSVVNA
jgi:4-hydroxy-tetrahydrodipicolinate synthase